MTKTNTISEATRRDIADYFVLNNITWAGRLSEPDFLARLYDLSQLPSEDHRCKNARGDIHQHRVSFNDWPDEWIFTDYRFAIFWVSDEEFMRFLCETLHPIVRPKSEDARSLATQFNIYLNRDGWEIFEETELSGRPIFGARKLGRRAIIFNEPTGWEKVDRQIQEVRLRLDEAESEEQFQAVGLICREVLISVSQVIYDHARHCLTDGLKPSSTDASRMLEGFFTFELQGTANEEARCHAKAALKPIFDSDR